MYLKLKKTFDHYNFKLEKLRQYKNIKIAKQQQETKKELERFDRVKT